MEHIVQFAIGIDDDAITKRIQENAEKIITQQIQQKVEKSIFETDYYGKPTTRFNWAAESIIMKWLDSHRDKIIQIASTALAERMIKTKAVKSAIEDVLKGGEVNASN